MQVFVRKGLSSSAATRTGGGLIPWPVSDETWVGFTLYRGRASAIGDKHIVSLDIKERVLKTI